MRASFADFGLVATQSKLPHNESLKFMLLPENGNHGANKHASRPYVAILDFVVLRPDVTLFGDIAAGDWVSCTPLPAK